MKAEQIRQAMVVNERDMAREIAAQLAEMNEKLERMVRVFEYLREADDSDRFRVPGEDDRK